MERAVCFDLGGTLIDRARHEDCVAYWGTRGVVVDARVAAAVIYRTDHFFMEHLPALWHAQGPEFHAHYWRMVHAGLGVPPPHPAVCARWGGPWRVYRDALGALQRLRRAGHRLALVSNWDLSGREVLQQSGLSPWFDVVAFSAELGWEKPDARIFSWATERLGVPPEHCVHVGDNPLDDGIGARAAGMRAVLLHRHAEWAAAPRGGTVVPDLGGAFVQAFGSGFDSALASGLGRGTQAALRADAEAATG